MEARDGGTGRGRATALACALADAAGLLLFTGVGIAMHGAAFAAGPILRNAVPFVGLWFLLAPLTRVYRQPGWRTLFGHWALVLPLAVAARQVWVGRLVSRATVAFFIASLTLTLAFLIAGRLAVWVVARTQAGTGEARSASRPDP